MATAGLTAVLRLLPDASAALVAATSGRVASIRVGTQQHFCATLWSPHVAVTCGRSLPEQDRYLLLLDKGYAIGRLAWRDPESGLAGVTLDDGIALPPVPAPRSSDFGSLLISVGIDEAGAPVAGLAVLRETGEAGAPPAVEMGAGRGDAGGLLIAPSGAVIGIVAGGAGDWRLVPYAEVERLVARAGPADTPRAEQPRKINGTAAVAPSPVAPSPGAGGWLGVGLQPFSVPRKLRRLAGQNSGRMVIDIIPGGPADRAGLLSGDIVLAIADHSMVGAGAVRDFLASQPIGEKADLVLLRDGGLVRLNITVCERPVVA